MPKPYEIRADYDRSTIIVYQAYSKEIALSAIQVQTFVPPFSTNRMTWIKPSFLWMMERSNWGHKSGQDHILAVRILRSGWEEALSMGVLTSPEKRVYPNPEVWRKEFASAWVHVQWDPERSLRGESQNYMSIQIGLSRHIIERYVKEWVVEIKDMTPLVSKLYRLIHSGQSGKVKSLLPDEKVYPVSESISRRLGMQ